MLIIINPLQYSALKCYYSQIIKSFLCHCRTQIGLQQLQFWKASLPWCNSHRNGQ
jgi:hypothetical protein